MSDSTANSASNVIQTQKQCTCCQQIKPLEYFSKNKKAKDGTEWRCKACRRRYNYQYHRSEAGRAAKLRYRKSSKGLAVKRLDGLKWRTNNRIKIIAHNLAKKAQYHGVLIVQPCEVCGNLKSEKHHDDYSKPLEVRWLCEEHHHSVHWK